MRTRAGTPVHLDLLNIRCTSALLNSMYGRGLRSGVVGERMEYWEDTSDARVSFTKRLQQNKQYFWCRGGQMK